MISFLFVCLPHPSPTDSVKPDPVDFFPSSSENLASPLRGEISNFTRPVCGFPGATFTSPEYIICVCLKKAKQRPDRKGQPGGKFARPVTFFQKTRWEYRCHRGVYCLRSTAQKYTKVRDPCVAGFLFVVNQSSPVFLSNVVLNHFNMSWKLLSAKPYVMVWMTSSSLKTGWTVLKMAWTNFDIPLLVWLSKRAPYSDS